MDLVFNGVKHLVAVIVGVTLSVFPSQSPPDNLPSPLPLATHTQNMQQQSEDLINISGDYKYMDKGVFYNVSFPKKGGDINGSIDGLCRGDITGNFSGGDQGGISGKAVGKCSLLFVEQSFDVTFGGNVWLKQGMVKIEDIRGKSGPFDLNGRSFTFPFKPTD